MVYKKGPPFKVRPVEAICKDLDAAHRRYGRQIRTIFLPAGNTIAMPTEGLATVCRFAGRCFPELHRITVYGSSQYIVQKGLANLKKLREAGLNRIHVGLESGDDEILKTVKKGTTAAEQIKAGRWVKEAGIELSEYVILGLGGVQRTEEHALATAQALNAIAPDFVRLRTLVPKINTLLLHQVEKGRFRLLSPHQVLKETRLLIQHLESRTTITSDHYTNYINLEGRLPQHRERLLRKIDSTLQWDEGTLRPHFVGTQ
jgi:radical SAM superfamily enzyme YgiQ (UPF0313 family)